MLASFAEELKRYGPDVSSSVPISREAAQAYCRRLARTHYENFTVASCLVPRGLRQHFYNIYAYCRWSDDLADEVPDASHSEALLDWWESLLDDCYAGRARHPVFVALQDTIDTFAIPDRPLRDLLVAFRQDQRTTIYETFDDLLGYCRNSANPVGHLVLYLGRSFDDTNAAYSDSICTGLQLANFWQDVARDWDIGRVYLPRSDCQRFGYDDAMFARRETNDAFRELMRFQVDRAERWLRDGHPLIARVAPELRVDVRLFQQGGLATLNAIRRIDYDVWRQRPTVGRWRKLRLLLDAWMGLRVRGTS